MLRLLRQLAQEQSLMGWNVSSLTYDSKSLLVSGETGNPQGLYFSDDGTKCYIPNGGNIVYQYSGTAGDISTFTYDSKSYTSSESSNLHHITWSDDGLKAYLSSRDIKTIHQYTASSAWDVSSLSYASKSMVTNSAVNLMGNQFFEGGTIMMTHHNVSTTGRTDYYTLSTAYDITSTTYVSAKSMDWNPSNYTQGFYAEPDGSQIATISSVDNKITIGNTTINFDWSTLASSSSKTITEETNGRGIYIREDKLFIIGLTSDSVFQFTMN